MAISPLVFLLLAFLQASHTQQRHRVIGLQSNSGQSARHKWPANYWQKPGFTGEIHFYIQGVSKKRYFLGFRVISILEVRFNLFTCVSESEF